MPTGTASKIYSLDIPVNMVVGPVMIPGNSSMRSVRLLRRAWRGKVFPTALANRTAFGIAIIDGAKRVFDNALPDDDTEWLSINSSCIRANVSAAGLKKSDGSGGQETEVLGRSQGGFGSKIHTVVTPMGHLIAVAMTRVL